MSGATGLAQDPPIITVWIVEDNRALRETFADLIDSEADMHCAEALPDCERLFDALDAGGVPDVVLMDLGLPGASGVEGIRRIHGMSPSTRVLVLTIHEDDERVFEAITAGASGYLLKPLPPDAVLEAIRGLVKGAAPINPFVARKLLDVFAQHPPVRPRSDEYGLTAREREILQLLVDGLALRAIGDRLGLSYHTISNHLRNVYAKLHVRSRSAAVSRALREDLL
ncbi:MAG: response regulator transcription factor [Xanthomonadales bacterium]|nr:response regulator transcription factor [Xanthomonadales bacterium]